MTLMIEPEAFSIQHDKNRENKTFTKVYQGSNSANNAIIGFVSRAQKK